MGAAFLEPAARHETLYRARTGTNNQVAPALRQEEQRFMQNFLEEVYHLMLITLQRLIQREMVLKQ